MEIRTLERIGAVAAVAGGALRLADDFLPVLHVPNGSLELAYFATDVLLLLGAFSFFARNASQLGWVGVAGFLVFFVGILLVRSPQIGSALGGYRSAAAIALVGIVVLGLAMLRARVARLAAFLWSAALGAGIAGSVGFQPALALLVSGSLFALGFITVGARELKALNGPASG
jgi:hypothetical protein